MVVGNYSLNKSKSQTSPSAGLRISELCGIHKDNIEVNGNHIAIQFTEFKKNKSRSIVLVDPKAMQLIEYYMACTIDVLFNTDKNRFNADLHKLAKQVFKVEVIYLHNACTNIDDKYLKR